MYFQNTLKKQITTFSVNWSAGPFQENFQKNLLIKKSIKLKYKKCDPMDPLPVKIS